MEEASVVGGHLSLQISTAVAFWKLRTPGLPKKEVFECLMTSDQKMPRANLGRWHWAACSSLTTDSPVYFTHFDLLEDTYPHRIFRAFNWHWNLMFHATSANRTAKWTMGLYECFSRHKYAILADNHEEEKVARAVSQHERHKIWKVVCITQFALLAIFSAIALTCLLERNTRLHFSAEPKLGRTSSSPFDLNNEVADALYRTRTSCRTLWIHAVSTATNRTTVCCCWRRLAETG